MKVQFDVNDAAGRDHFIAELLGEALGRLAPDRKPEWGGFTAPQMVEHLVQAFEISTGRLKVACATPEDWRIKARRFLHDNRPMPHGFDSPLLRDGAPPLRFETIPHAIEALRNEARRFLDLSASDPDSSHMHPVFGECNASEWSRVHFKHGVHHLLQFGLIEVEEVVEPVSDPA